MNITLARFLKSGIIGLSVTVFILSNKGHGAEPTVYDYSWKIEASKTDPDKSYVEGSDPRELESLSDVDLRRIISVVRQKEYAISHEKVIDGNSRTYKRRKEIEYKARVSKVLRPVYAELASRTKKAANNQVAAKKMVSDIKQINEKKAPCEKCDAEIGVIAPSANPLQTKLEGLKVPPKDPIQIKTRLCSPESNYFESRFSRLAGDPRYTGIGGAVDVSRECIAQAQMNWPGQNYSAKCDSDNALPNYNLSFQKPCSSNSYQKVLHASYVNVMNCFGLSQKTFFPLIVRESGFQINAYNESNNTGLGQFTTPAIDQVNLDYFMSKEALAKYYNQVKAQQEQMAKDAKDDALKLKQNPNVKIDKRRYPPVIAFPDLKVSSNSKLAKMMVDPNSEACQNVKNTFRGPASSAQGRRCAFINTPSNPARSFVYFALLQKLNSQIIDDNVRKVLNEKVNKKQLSQSDSEVIIEHLNLLAHNAGAGSTAALALKFGKEKGWKKDSFKALANAPTIGDYKGDKGKDHFYSYVMRYYRSDFERRKTLAEYLINITQDAAKINNNMLIDKESAGAQCSDIGLK